LLQTLAGDLGNDEVDMTNPNEHIADATICPNTESSHFMSNSGRRPDFTPAPAPQSAACAASSSNDIQDFVPSDRENPTHSTRVSSLSSNDLVPPLVPDLRPTDKAFKKVVALKDKFMTVSATARQCYRLAKQALTNAQRSAAAAQCCLAAAESFVPCVREVIFTIRRMELASEASGPSSDWIAVLRELEDGLHDIKQWSSVSKKLDASGQHPLHSRNSQLPPSPPPPSGSSGFLLTSVEEEAQEALRAWNQLDPETHETDSIIDNGGRRREPGLRNDDGVSSESAFYHAQRRCMEAEVSRHQEMRKVGNQVLEELAETSTRNLVTDREPQEQENLQAGGRESVEPEVAIQSRRNVEERMNVESAIGATDPQESAQDDRMQELCQQQSAQTCGPATNGDIGNISPCPQDNVSRASKVLLDRDAPNLPPALAASIENDTEQEPASVSKSSSSNIVQLQVDRQPPSPISAVSDEASVVSNGCVAPTENASGSQAETCTVSTIYANSETSASSGGENGNTVMLQLKIILPEAQTPNSQQLRDMSCTLPIKLEQLDPQLNFKAEEHKAVDEPLKSNGSLAGVEVKPTSNIPESKTPILPLSLQSSANECKSEIKPPCGVSYVGMPAPVPEGLSVMKQKQPEVDVASTVPFKIVAPPLGSPSNVASIDISSAQSIRGPAEPSPTGSRASQLIVTVPTISQPEPVPVHPPNYASATPLALRVESPARPNHMQDPDDSMGPDLMSSRGWDADENDGSRSGRKHSPGTFESMPRGRRRGVESLNQADHRTPRVPLPPASHHASSHLETRLSRSPSYHLPSTSNEAPAPLIGKKRPRDEERPSGPSRNMREWTGAGISSPSANDTSHSRRLELPTTSVAQPGYNSMQHPRSFPRRRDPSPESTVEVASPQERRMQHPSRSQQPPQNRQRVGGYDSYRPSYNSHNDRRPELLNRLTSAQGDHTQFDSARSHPNIGRASNQSNRPHGRGKGLGVQGGSFQQNNFSKKPLSLLDRIDKQS
jgi:hypothetical protein